MSPKFEAIQNSNKVKIFFTLRYKCIFHTRYPVWMEFVSIAYIFSFFFFFKFHFDVFAQKITSGLMYEWIYELYEG